MLNSLNHQHLAPRQWLQGAFLGSALVLGAALAFTPPAISANLPEFTQIVKENADTVVNIRVFQKASKFEQATGNLPDLAEQFPGFPPEILRHFFGIIPKVQPDQSPNNGNGGEREVALGSGFIISRDGYILTNNHVIKDGDKVVVRLNDRSEKIAKVIGSDKLTDIALLKIDGNNYPVAELGNSESLQVGEWVLAMGSPFGFDHSVTAGIVSAKRRSLPDENYVPFIQTDVAVNPGNSGGPLFDLDGKVVGINSQIYSKSGGFMGLSFAIPINLAMNVVEQLKSHGKVQRGYLGVQLQEVTKDLSESFGMDRPYGALVAKVFTGTPAEKAKLQEGDVILQYNGNEIHQSADLPPYVGITPPGEVVEMVILRRGDEQKIKVTIGQVPDENEPSLAETSEPGSTQTPFGAQLKDLSEKELDELGLTSGVQVVKVIDGPAREAGLRRGDVIVSVNFNAIKSTEQFEKLLSKLPKNRRIPMRVIRGNSALFVPFVIR